MTNYDPRCMFRFTGARNEWDSFLILLGRVNTQQILPPANFRALLLPVAFAAFVVLSVRNTLGLSTYSHPQGGWH